MKVFFRNIVVNIRPISQIVGLFIVFFLPSILKVSSMVTETIKIEASKDWQDFVFYFAWSKGDWAIGVFFFVATLFLIRRINKICLFNKGDHYKNYPYTWYWICAKILGYRKCNLILVPISMQFKLVIRDTFEEYHCGTYSHKDNDIISIEKSNMNEQVEEVNLIIADTYPLFMDQIPVSKRKFPTIQVSRNNKNDSNRYDSPQLVQAVVNEVRMLPSNLKNINVYATTNPLNTVNMVNNAFKLGERGNVDMISVFQQKQTGMRKFRKEGIVVYKR